MDEPSQHTPSPRYLLGFLAGACLLALILPLGRAGLWNPHEVDVVELCRRIALNLLGGEELRIEGADNLVPILADLGRGELPLTSMALGLRVFGLHAWAARLPLLLWALTGLGATYFLVARLAGRVAGATSFVVLATMPIYFLHARTALGDMVTMSSAAIATTGFALATFDERLGRAARASLFGLGCLGLATGFLSRGVWISVVVPPLAVGLASAFLSSPKRGAPSFPRLSTSACLVLGFAGVLLGAYGWFRTRGHDVSFSWLMGGKVLGKPAWATFDSVILTLGHSLFPWSAVVPAAVGSLFWSSERSDESQGRGAALRVTLLLSACLGFFVHGWFEPVTGPVPFAQVFALAAIVGVCIETLHQRRRGAPVLALVVAALAVVFALDFVHFPDKALTAFGVEKSVVPDSFKNLNRAMMQGGVLLFVGAFVLSLLEPDGLSAEFSRDRYLAWFRWLGGVRGGLLLPWLFAVEALLLLAAALLFIGERFLHLSALENLFIGWRLVMKFGWLGLPLLVFAAPVLALCVRDAVRWLYARFGVSRALGAFAAPALFGLAFSFYYFPALALQLSPLEAFHSYEKYKAPGESLALLRTRAAVARYYTGSDVVAFSNPEAALGWLVHPSERRWLIALAEDVPKLNSGYRAKTKPPENLPVLDARSSEILLVSNRLRDSEEDQNPFKTWVLSERPAPAHPVSANFDSKLEVLGWEVRTPDGKLVDAVSPGRDYELTLFYEVVSAVGGSWDTFVHIDGPGRRYNGDHKTLEGKYGFAHWQVGDFIADRHVIRLEPYFTPGDCVLRFGLYAGQNRMAVKRGDHSDNRVNGGVFRVR